MIKYIREINYHNWIAIFGSLFCSIGYPALAFLCKWRFTREAYIFSGLVFLFLSTTFFFASLFDIVKDKIK